MRFKFKLVLRGRSLRRAAGGIKKFTGPTPGPAEVWAELLALLTPSVFVARDSSCVGG